jgi:ketosteroid isomerase-like protein/quercetin dioxygenase-like cupin family protein
MRRWIALLFITALCGACSSSSANVEQERETLMRLDREWSGNVKDMDKFISYYAPDATVYPPGMPMATGVEPIRDTLTKITSTPGFILEFGPTKADVSASGDVGYTTGTYRATINGAEENGKYVEVWKKQPDGSWKVKEDIFNADNSGVPATSHVMVEAGAIKWGDPPPSMPAGAKIAVIAGDPSKPGPFVVRVQVPAGYRIAPHWHPGDENVTIFSGTVALGMGETWDDSTMKSIGTGGYAALPAEMRHYFLAKTASTLQVHGIGPFVINYVNPADDPSKK